MGQFLWSGVSARPWNVAADRFAPEIGGFLTGGSGALAAAERQAVSPLLSNSMRTHARSQAGPIRRGRRPGHGRTYIGCGNRESLGVSAMEQSITMEQSSAERVGKDVTERRR